MIQFNKDICPFCNAKLEFANFKKSILICNQKNCEYKFTNISNIKYLFYLDIQKKELDVVVSLKKNFSHIREYNNHKPLLNLDQIFDPYKASDMIELNKILTRLVSCYFLI